LPDNDFVGSIAASAVVDSWPRLAFKRRPGLKSYLPYGGGGTVISTVVPSVQRMVIVSRITVILPSRPAGQGWPDLFADYQY
jgi:hypothetical protein